MRSMFLASIVLASVAAACRDTSGPAPGSNGEHETAGLAVAVNLVGAPEVTQVRLRVTAEDLPAMLEFGLPIVDGQAHGVVSVPTGPLRMFTLQALDADQVVRYQGSATVDVMVGPNPALTVSMSPVNPGGEVPITARIGGYMVEVVPSTAAIDVGGRVRLSATVHDPWGNLVGNAVVSWASSDPSVASVDAFGEVTGRAVGVVTMQASYAGEVDSATIEVGAGDPSPDPTVTLDTIFRDDFEMGLLGDDGRWQDIFNTGATIVRAADEGISARAGMQVLKIQPPGVALSHFVATGASSSHERLRFSWWMYRTSTYDEVGLRSGSIRGSATQWGSFGVGGSCPDSRDQEFFVLNLMQPRDGWPLRLYNYWLGMQKQQASPPLCFGTDALGPDDAPRALYHDPTFAPAAGQWHQFEMEVQLNTPGAADGWERVWVDGVLRIEHLDVRYRNDPATRIWAVSFDTGSMTNPGSVIYIDDVTVAVPRAP